MRPVTSYTLPNGLKVLLYPDVREPTLTVNVVYKTGAKHEGPREYGMAHLLEHMAFQNTQNFRDIPRELERRGARFNANTNADRTTYYETLPASPQNLDYALAMEADRMSLALLTESALQQELVAVKKEWENSGRSGFQPLLQEMMAIAYPHHPYGRDTFGLEAGLLQARLEDIQAFYQRRYHPGLAVLSIGGAFAIEDAQRLIEKYFAPLLNRTATLDERAFELKPQFSERMIVIPKPGGPSYVGLIYRAMPGADPSFVAAQALVHCLSSHRDSPLQKKLIQTGLAREAFGFVQQSVDEGFIVFMAKPGPGRDARDLLQRLARLVESSAGSCQDKDLRRFQAENTAAWADVNRNVRAFTMQLGEFEVLGDWRLIQKEPIRSQELRLELVKNVARWLTPHNRTAGVLDPKSSHSLAGRRDRP
ncbi:MAG TPA: pitrilysin family protein [Oligoflexus sp.]|uniref:M16 family metallopeptidase n=1 Tax=Oligoflexus sp. TaxID=1971216 RepID=UPI002D7F0CB7|nr:pitrilysin family protein [Oligoflexus sp.]HET9241299.1 pitrilysin family protein [Oligoflexus sp.]